MRSSYLWLLHDPLFSTLLESLGLYCVYCVYLIFEGLFKNMDHTDTLICQNPLAHIRNKINSSYWGRFCVSEWKILEILHSEWRNPSIKQLWLEHIKPQNHHYWLNKNKKNAASDRGRKMASTCHVSRSIQGILAVFINGVLHNKYHLPTGSHRIDSRAEPQKF